MGKEACRQTYDFMPSIVESKRHLIIPPNVNRGLFALNNGYTTYTSWFACYPPFDKLAGVFEVTGILSNEFNLYSSRQIISENCELVDIKETAHIVPQLRELAHTIVSNFFPGTYVMPETVPSKNDKNLYRYYALLDLGCAQYRQALGWCLASIQWDRSTKQRDIITSQFNSVINSLFMAKA